MRKMIVTLSFLLLLTKTLAVNAGTLEEKMYLRQVYNSLSAIKPLVLQAAKEAPQNVRMQFHYTRYKDADGHWHNGLLEDLTAMQQGIAQKLNEEAKEPRRLSTLKEDYISGTKGTS